jgi:hypothetical protein
VISRWSCRAAAVLVVIATMAVPARTSASPAADGATALPAQALSAVPPRPTNLNDAVGWANYERAFGENLPPVTTSAALSGPPQTHANWLAAFHAAGDPYCAHGQDATHTWPTGEDHSHNVLFCGPMSIGAAIQGWVDTPYHGAGFVDPTVGAIGFGFALDTSTALFAYNSAPPALSRWPKPDGLLPSPAMVSGESPDPRAACGYDAGPIGRPIFLTVPAAEPFGSVAVTGPNGPVPACALHADPFEAGAPTLEAGETTRQVAILTPAPYAVGQVYTASVTMTSGVYTWSFLVGDAPAAPTISAGPTGPGQISVSWLPAEGHGVPITGYAVTNLTTGDVHRVSGDQTAAAFGALVPGATYEFQVTAESDLGTSPPADASATALDVPAAPVIVTALPGSASAFVSWSYLSSAAAPVDSFQMNLDGGPPFAVGTAADYTVAGLLQGHQYAVRVRAVNAAGPGPWSAPGAVTPHPAGLLFHGLPLPQRALDTRMSGGPIAAGALRVVPVVAVTEAAPEAVAAISLNLTAADPTGPGYLTAWPCNGAPPTASSVNYGGGEHGVPNHVIVPVSADGTICVLAGVNATDVVVDVDGWFSRDAGLVPDSPHRELDTRTTGGPKTDVTVHVAPPGARAAIVNITAAGGSGAAGYVTAYACDGSPPLVSNVNFGAGQTVANAAVAPVAADGSICLHASAATNLVVDVAGYVIDNFVPVGPTRLLDTRSSGGRTVDVTLAAVPAGAMGAVLNATAAGGSAAPGYVTVHPADGPVPSTSNLNFGPGQVVPNAVVVRPDDAGRIRLAASTPVQLVVDVFGYFR